MKKIFFILTLILSGLVSSGAAARTGCERLLPKSRLSFYTSYGKLRYDFSKDQMGITNVGIKFGVVEKGVFANGLATGTVKWEIDVSSEGRMGSGGTVCAYPVEIKFYLGFADPRIYVSRDLRKGSCMYDLVLRHEQTHQQINVKALDYFIPLFRQALEKISREIPAQPVEAATTAALSRGSEKIAELYSRRLEPLINVFKKELEIEQGKLDNPSNYEFENSICR